MYRVLARPEERGPFCGGAAGRPRAGRPAWPTLVFEPWLDTLDTHSTLPRHRRHRRHWCQPTPPRHPLDTVDTADTQARHRGCSDVVNGVNSVRTLDTPTPSTPSTLSRHRRHRRHLDTPGLKHRSCGPRTQVQRSQDTGPAVPGHRLSLHCCLPEYFCIARFNLCVILDNTLSQICEKRPRRGGLGTHV